MNILLCLLFMYVENISSVRIIKNPKIYDGQQYNLTFLNTPNIENSGISLCWWIKTLCGRWEMWFNYPGTMSIIIQDHDKKGENLFFWLDKEEEYKTHDVSLPDANMIVPYSWTLICLTYDNDEQTVGIYINSKQVYLKSLITKKFLQPMNSLQRSYFQIGKETGNFDLTGFNIWSTVLTKEDVGDIFLCSADSIKAKLMTWENIIVQVAPPNDDIQIDPLATEEGPCVENKEHIYVFDAISTMDDNRQAVRICSGLGGTMRSLQNQEDLKKLDKARGAVKQIWVPVYRENGVWKDYKGVPVSFLPWTQGGALENTDCVYYDQNVYWNADCHSNFHFYCHLKSHHIFKLKGQIHCRRNINLKIYNLPRQ